jgi:hypothetical protein
MLRICDHFFTSRFPTTDEHALILKSDGLSDFTNKINLSLQDKACRELKNHVRFAAYLLYQIDVITG